MNKSIFREYDIRGEVANDLAPEVVARLGRALAVYFTEKRGRRVVLGRDVRSSSDRLRADLVEAFLAAGLTVLDLGCCPTPAFYFGSLHLAADAGVMITGSHNPPGENGFKLIWNQQPVYGTEIRKIGRIAQSEVRPEPTARRGSVMNIDILDEYRAGLRAGLKAVSPDSSDRPRLKVVVDCGNGTAGPFAVPLYEWLGCDVVPLFCEPDGAFPNHHPDPTVAANLQDLIQLVRESRADVGLAFDGDSDRLGAVDERGGIFWGDDLLTIFSRALLSERPGATIIGDVKCSARLFDDITARGGQGMMWKSGHSLIKAKAREVGALLAGEWSGHFCFSDRYFGFDDGIYAGGRLIEILGRSSDPASVLLSDLPQICSAPEIRLSCPDSMKFQVVERLMTYFAERYDTITLDGVRIVMQDAWALVRASNTQPVLVMRFEARSPERLEEIRSMVERNVSETMTTISSGECRCSTS
ncbi:MAG: phosphomannomutase/phosphoglucomutase [Acidobacteriota bacterium]